MTPSRLTAEPTPDHREQGGPERSGVKGPRTSCKTSWQEGPRASAQGLLPVGARATATAAGTWESGGCVLGVPVDMAFRELTGAGESRESRGPSWPVCVLLPGSEPPGRRCACSVQERPTDPSGSGSRRPSAHPSVRPSAHPSGATPPQDHTESPCHFFNI